MTALCYNTDLSDREWAILAPLVVPTTRRGRPRKHERVVFLHAGLQVGGEQAHDLPLRNRKTDPV
jgi:hypothetical protein